MSLHFLSLKNSSFNFQEHFHSFYFLITFFPLSIKKTSLKISLRIPVDFFSVIFYSLHYLFSSGSWFCLFISAHFFMGCWFYSKIWGSLATHLYLRMKDLCFNIDGCIYLLYNHRIHFFNSPLLQVGTLGVSTGKIPFKGHCQGLFSPSPSKMEAFSWAGSTGYRDSQPSPKTLISFIRHPLVWPGVGTILACCSSYSVQRASIQWMFSWTQLLPGGQKDSP